MQVPLLEGNCYKNLKKVLHKFLQRILNTEGQWITGCTRNLQHFYKKWFSTIRLNFGGVGKSDGTFDNGQVELSDAAAALDWIERENQDYSQCWVSGFSFGSLICMQLIMRRPEVNRFIAIAPQPNVYDFTFLAPCPTSGKIISAEKDELVSKSSMDDLKNRLKNQKGIEVIFYEIKNSNHFFKNKEEELKKEINKYIEEKTELI